MLVLNWLIDENLSYIVNILKKISSSISALKRIRSFIFTVCTESGKLVEQYFIYCAYVWDGMGSKSCEKYCNKTYKIKLPVS